MDEIFGDENFVSLISFAKTTGLTSRYIPAVNDYLVWFAKSRQNLKFRRPLDVRAIGDARSSRYQLAELYDGSIRDLTSSDLDDPILPRSFCLE